MKKIITTLWMLLIASALTAQTPEAINYQAVARDAAGNPISNQDVSFRLSILQGSASGAVVYSEKQMITTNQYGLATLAIGSGTVLSGNFATIDWGNGAYFLQTEMDPDGGNDYLLMGTSQFLSVPYSLYSKTAGNGLPPAGSAGQTLRNNGTSWVSDQTLTNTGSQVGIGTATPDNSAMLDVNSANKGFLLPRVADTNAVENPVAGLEIYDISSHCLRYYTGTQWTNCLNGCQTPLQPSDISGNSNPCINDGGLPYSVQGVSGVSYNWTVPTGWSITNGQGTSSILVTSGTAAGTMTVIPFNSCGSGPVRTLALVPTTNPPQASAITGPATACQNTSGLTYSVTNIPGVTYNWTLPSDWIITAGQGTYSITVNTGTSSGTVGVTPSDVCGSGTPKTFAVTTIGTPPSQPSTISGPDSPCQNSGGQTYSVTNVVGVTYFWAVPFGWSITAGQGTSSITVTSGTASGTVGVIPSNSCGNGISRTLSVTVTLPPGQPTAIVGPEHPCINEFAIYDAYGGGPCNGYIWTVPPGWEIFHNYTTLWVRVGTASGNIVATPWSYCGDGTPKSFAVSSIDKPSQPSAITGPASPCQNVTGLSYSVSNVAGVTYTWSVPSDWSITAGQGTNSITVTSGTVSDTIRVTPSNVCGNGTTQVLAVTTTPVPAQPSAITGPASPCTHAYVTYSVTSVPGVTYSWTIPQGWVQTDGTVNSITVRAWTIGGTITVTPSNACGNGPSRSLAVTITNDVPDQPGLITGPASPCQNTAGLIYSVYNWPGVTYTWTVPAGWSITSGQGTSSITVTSGTTTGTMIVSPSNSCGDGPAQTLGVITTAVPVQPSTITGPASPCQNTSGLVYSVTTVAGVTYTWTVPAGWSITAGQGTNGITVTSGTASGNISVSPANACGTGTTPRTLAVTTITSVPLQPSVISGPASPCQFDGDGLVYSVTTVNGVSYYWELPSDWNIDAGQGSSTIYVFNGSSSGSIKVTPSNACGSGTPRTLAVTTTASAPSQPSVITGLNNPCHNTSGLTYSVSNDPGVTYYNWLPPAGWTITAGQGTSGITVTSGTASGNMVVIPSNSCGAGSSRTMAVITAAGLPLQPSSITGPAFPCKNTANLSYSVTNVPGVSYTWTVPTGWSVTGGAGTSGITVTSGTTSGTVRVTPSNGCGNGTDQTLTVTTAAAAPSQPSVISGPASVCQDDGNINYSVTAVSGVTYHWTVPLGWYIDDGEGTNSIHVTLESGVSGSITVTPSNGCGSGPAQTLTVAVVPSVPSQPSVISGPANSCQNTASLAYSVTGVAGVTYNWSLPSGWLKTAGGTSAGITVTSGTASGTIAVTPSNGCGNGTQRTLFVTTTAAVPLQPLFIDGPTSPCQNTAGLLYSVTNDPGATYAWLVPSGWSITSGGSTSSITLTSGSASGTVAVIPLNSCGPGTAQTLSVTTSTIPSQPSVITGPTAPCQNTASLTYSVTNVSGITYTWTVPTGWSINSGQGSNAITVTSGTAAGNIVVTPSSSTSCIGTARTLAVTTSTIPAVPSDISGPASVCQNTAGLGYSVTNVAGVSYDWNLPSGWSVTAGAGTSSITVTSGTAAGTIRVRPYNNCGYQGGSNLIVTTTAAAPLQPDAITGPAYPCHNTAGLTYSVTNVAGVTYTWSVPSDWIITAGQGTSGITVTCGTAADTIRVTPSNVCGNGTEQKLAVAAMAGIPSQPSAITGPASPCQNTTGRTYSVTNVAGTSYTWTVPSDWSITAGQGTNGITVTSGTSSGNISVTPANACGTGTTPRTKAVTTTAAAPSQPSVISGPTSPCRHAEGLIYSVTNVPGVTYSWSVPTGWSITAGGGTSSITVQAGSGGGTITVTPSNSCGNGTGRTLAVTTTSCK